MLLRAVHLDPIPETCSSLSQQNLNALLGCDLRSEDRSHLHRLHSRPSRPQSVSRPPETHSVSPVQPCQPLPAGRQTRTFLPRNSDAGLASALPCSLVRCLPACLFLDTAAYSPCDRSNWRWALLQPPGEPSRSSPWSTSSLGASLDAPRSRGFSAPTFSASRSSTLCRSVWCCILLPSLPLTPGEPSCSPRRNTSSLGASLDAPCGRGQPTSSSAFGRRVATPSGQPRSL
jgi:hypothetical protein